MKSAKPVRCANIRRLASIPANSASRTRLAVAIGLSSSSHNTALGTRRRISIQQANICGFSLYALLNEAKTNLSSGKPCAALEVIAPASRRESRGSKGASIASIFSLKHSCISAMAEKRSARMKSIHGMAEVPINPSQPTCTGAGRMARIAGRAPLLRPCKSTSTSIPQSAIS